MPMWCRRPAWRRVTHPGGVDPVAADPVVGVGVAAAGGKRLRERGVDGGGGGPVRQGPVRAPVVVGGDERVEQGLQLADRGGLVGLGGQPLLHGLLESLGFAAGGGVVGAGVLLHHAQAPQLGLEGVAAAFAAGVAGGVDHRIVRQRRGGDAVVSCGVGERALLR